jgi:HlyB family type I secretion system ABC transporter
MLQKMRSLASKADALARRQRSALEKDPDQAAAATADDRLLGALEQLFQYLDRSFTRAEILAAAPPSDGHFGLGGALRAADRLGFAAREIELRRRSLKEIRTPCIILGRWPGEVWVLRSRKKDHLIVVDPLTGAASAADEETVLAMADRALLLCKRSARAPASRWRDDIVRRLRPVLGELIVASTVINLLALATPIFLMTVYNKVINHGALETLDVLALGMLTLFVFEWLLRTVRGYISSYTGGRLDAALGSEVIHHLVHLPLRALDGVPSGQILERARQLDTLRQFFTGQMPLLLVDLAFVVLFLGVLFYLDPRLGWITFAAMPAFWLLSLAGRRRQRDLVEANFRASAAKTSSIGETIGGAYTVKALGLEPEMEQRFKRRLAESAWTSFKANHLNALLGSSGQALQHLVALTIVYVGARAIVAGDMSIGALIAATILAARALAPMRQVVGAWQQVQSVRDAFSRLDQLMSEPVEMRRAPMPPMRLQGRIRFDHVTFSYRGEGPPALDRVDFEVTPGQVLVVLGPPGSGKSTLARLILGLDRPASGRLLIDDLDVRLFSPTMLRQQIGAVPQDVQLFTGTIRENIALGAEDRSFERVVAAAKFVGAHDFIQRLPDGYETVLGERGGGLSAGQRQLVSIARAVIRNPRILILDEATSALDGATEDALLKSLKRASRGRTVILVTHRLQALQIADQVLYLRDGRVDDGPRSSVPEPAFRPEGGGPFFPHLQPV